VQDFYDRRQADIDAILLEYGVPLLPNTPVAKKKDDD